MEIRAALDEDLEHFSVLARREGWRVPEGELALYGNELAGSAFVLCREEERLGYVTAVGYARSGWIGNLLVPQAYRRRGYGTLLFEHALDVLRFVGVSEVWLTASASGRPIYERKGFRSAGRIARWSHRGIGTASPMEAAQGDRALLARLDRKVWGEWRGRLIEPLCRSGQVMRSGATAALLQAGEMMRVLGPWITETACPRENREILFAALEACGPVAELVVDVFTSSPCAALPRMAGFVCQGENELMVLGEARKAELGSLVSLGSLGSIG